MDSATMLYMALEKSFWGFDPFGLVEAISFNYGQRHVKELDYAAALCKEKGVRHEVIDISALRPFIGGSALTDDIAVPEGHYESASMKLTVVPNRNAIMLSIAVGVAVARGATAVGAAMHAGDHAVYPDCRPAFVKTFQTMTNVATEGSEDSPIIWAPFIDKSKADIARWGKFLGVNYSLTWSCYKGGEYHCGKCGTCVERIEAFELIDEPDPTTYQ
jgi:7-cyano-7-deazaguanine synthase